MLVVRFWIEMDGLVSDSQDPIIILWIKLSFWTKAMYDLEFNRPLVEGKYVDVLLNCG